MTLQVPGNTHINTGHIIRVNIPRPGGGKTVEKSNATDRYYSGRWLITAVRHNLTFAPKMHKSVITCIKETYQNPLPTKEEPFQVVLKDEGKPVNIKDDSVY